MDLLLGSASQIALFVAPVLVLLSYVLGPTPMTLVFWPGACSGPPLSASRWRWEDDGFKTRRTARDTRTRVGPRGSVL